MNIPLQEDIIDKEDIAHIVRLLQSGEQITMGKYVEKFEMKFASFLNSPYAVMVNSGSSANLLAFSALNNLMEDTILDSVLIPVVCWSTSLYPILQMGYTPIFVDVSLDNLQIDIDKLEEAIVAHRPSALMLVHILGITPNMDRIMKLVQQYNLILVEDTCEALGSVSAEQQYLGTFGRFGTFSFFYSHHISCFEGGMVVCQTEKDYNLLRCMRAHGWSRQQTNADSISAQYPDLDSRYLFINLGYNLRPTEINAVLGLQQLDKLQKFNDTRIYNYNKLYERLVLNSHLQLIPPVSGSAYFAFPILVRESSRMSELKSYLSKHGIQNRPILSGNFIRQPVLMELFKHLHPENFPNADKVHFNGLYIGIGCCHRYTTEEIDSICGLFDTFWKSKN